MNLVTVPQPMRSKKIVNHLSNPLTLHKQHPLLTLHKKLPLLPMHKQLPLLPLHKLNTGQTIQKLSLYLNQLWEDRITFETLRRFNNNKTFHNLKKNYRRKTKLSKT